MAILLIFTLGLLLIINAIVTIAVARSESYEPKQKLLQLMVIWLIPILGAAFLWYLIHEDSHTERRYGASSNEHIEYNYPDKRESHSGHHGDMDGGD